MYTIHSTVPYTIKVVSAAMESGECMVLVPRLNALVREADLHLSVLETVQKMGYDKPSENQALAIKFTMFSFLSVTGWIAGGISSSLHRQNNIFGPTRP